MDNLSGDLREFQKRLQDVKEATQRQDAIDDLLEELPARLSLERLCRSEPVINVLHELIKKRYAQDNLYYYLCIQGDTFGVVPSVDVKTTDEELYNHYIIQDSPRQTNMSSQTISKIIEYTSEADRRDAGRDATGAKEIECAEKLKNTDTATLRQQASRIMRKEGLGEVVKNLGTYCSEITSFPPFIDLLIKDPSLKTSLLG